MRWYAIRVQNAKVHVVDEALCDGIVEDLRERSGQELNAKCDCAFYRFDLGGPVIISQPYDEIALTSGLTVEFACLDVNEFAEVLKELQPRKTASATYYKVHGEYMCLVLSETDRAELLTKLEACKAASYRRWEEFKSGWERRSSEPTQIRN